jgi:hypothetical protein
MNIFNRVFMGGAPDEGGWPRHKQLCLYFVDTRAEERIALQDFRRKYGDAERAPRVFGVWETNSDCGFRSSVAEIGFTDVRAGKEPEWKAIRRGSALTRVAPTALECVDYLSHRLRDGLNSDAPLALVGRGKIQTRNLKLENSNQKRGIGIWNAGLGPQRLKPEILC